MAEPVAHPDVHALAGELRAVVGVLVRRFRADGPLPAPQLTTLAWLGRQGARTTSQLAALERVRPQSMAQTVGELAAAGYVERRPDPADGRQTLIDLTSAGRAMLEEYRRVGERWVAEALTGLDEADQATLARAVDLLRGLVEP